MQWLNCMWDCDLFQTVDTGGLQHIVADTNDQHFAYEIFVFIFVNGNCCILIQMSMKSASKSPFDNKSTLFQIMVWFRTGDKSEYMVA